LALARTAAFFYYPAYDPIPDLGPLNPYIEWWSRLLSQNSRPTRKDLRFQDLAGWHARLTLCHVLEDGSDMVAHIVGEDVKALFKSVVNDRHLDFTKGTRLRDLIDVDSEAQRQHLAKITLIPSIAISKGELTLVNDRKIAIASLDFPLMPAPDETPYVLSLYDFEAPFLSRRGL
jgi:hypothetical protein